MQNRSGLISISLIVFATVFLDITLPTTVAAAVSIEARVYMDKQGNTMPYRILKPASNNPLKKYPLVLCLHGAGGRGDDNKSRGTEAFTVLSKTDVQEKFPSFIITPQCPVDKQWVKTPWTNGSYSISKIPISGEMKLAVEILDLVTDEFNIDSNRVYVTGQSMGGYGTWDLILRYPKRFAAAVPVCGAGDPANAKSIAHIPIWAFHGDRDKTVPTRGTQKMIEALKQAGGRAKYTEYEGVGHNCWTRAWKEKDLITWLFRQNNK